MSDAVQALLKDLQERGLIHDHTDLEALVQALTPQPGTAPPGVYAGFDPTAPTLHLGNFIAILGLMRFQRAGLRPIAVVGGATGMIGDPSGKTSERELLSQEALEANKAGIRAQLERYLDFSGPHGALLLDNHDWTAGVGVLAFLRDVGKHFSVSAMLHKESVAERLKREAGISYTEFSYMLLQAYDFMVLTREQNCVLQLGGSDQWGNITAGIELTRRVLGQHVHGLTFPLITNAQGQKFGKSEGQALWLDPALTSPYRLYQYFLNTDDRDVPRYLNFFTFLSQQERAELAAEHQKDPGQHLAHRKLAEEVTRLLHGEAALQGALQASQALFGGTLASLPLQTLQSIKGDVPHHPLPSPALARGVALVDLLAESRALPSKAEARRKLRENAVSVNDLKTQDEQRVITPADTLHGRFIALKVGKKNYTLVEVTP